MDVTQDYVNFLGGMLMALFGWIGKTLWDAVGKLNQDLADLQKHLPAAYVSKADFQRYEDRVLDYLERIEQKLDSKADKEKL